MVAEKNAAFGDAWQAMATHGARANQALARFLLRVVPRDRPRQAALARPLGGAAAPRGARRPRQGPGAGASQGGRQRQAPRRAPSFASGGSSWTGSAVVAFLAATALVPLAPALAAPPVVDLDSPRRAGAAAQRSGRRRLQKVIGRCWRDAERMPEKQVEGWIRTRYDADAVHLGSMLLVSYPPKRRLSFSLEKVAYVATIVVALPPATIVPAR